MYKRCLFFLVLSSFVLYSCSDNSGKRIVCIGDSITEGAGLKYQSSDSYPAQLDQILGNGFEVVNCGQSAATMLKQSDYSYWQSNEFSNVFTVDPDIVVIALGTNDSKDHNWDADRFKQDYQSMIDLLKSSNPGVRIYVCLPPPAFNHAWGINDSTIRHGIIPILRELTLENKLRLIDLYTDFQNHPVVFPDSIHPNEAGAKMMAEFVAREIEKI
jgi:alpha-L-fucosidase 2